MSSMAAVILTYNKAPIFDMFLQSFLRQTRQPDRIIVVDDASTDGMQRHLEALPDTWQIFQLPRNRGQSHARNVGSEHAYGDYLIFLDADIEMEPEMLEVMENALERLPEASFAYGHFERAGSRQDRVRAVPWNAPLLRRFNYISTMSLVRRADLPKPPFDEELRRYEDWDLWLRMSGSGKTGILIDQVLFTAHHFPDDLSGKGESTYLYEAVKKKHGIVFSPRTSSGTSKYVSRD